MKLLILCSQLGIRFQRIAMPLLDVRTVTSLLNFSLIMFMKTDKTIQANSFKRTSFGQESSVETCNISTINPFCGKHHTVSQEFLDYHWFIILADFPYNTYGRQGRIYKGKQAKNIIPYQVRIVVENSTNEKNWTCGGTIISSNHVLTSRYCIENDEFGFADMSTTYVEAGFYKISGRESLQSYQVHSLLC